MHKARERGGKGDDRFSAHDSLAAGEWFWETGPDHRFTYFSGDGQLTTGLHGCQVIGKRRDELAENSQGAKWLAHLADLEARRPFRGFEYTIRRPDGDSVHLSVSGEPRYGEAGEFLGYRGAASDVTPRKRIEKELRDTVGLVQALLEAAPFEIAVKDSEGRYLQVNSVWEAWHGMRRGDVFGMSTTDIFPAEVARSYAALDREALEGRRIFMKEEILHDADGAPRTVLAVRFPVPVGNDAHPGIGLISVDITEQKRTEQALRERETELRTVADNLPAFIAYIDKEQRYRFVNRVVEDWYGRPARDILGRTVEEMIRPETYEILRPRFAALMDGQRMQFEDTVEYPDGRRRTVSFDWVPEMDSAGRVRGWFSLVQDITQRKRIEAELLRKERLAAMGELTGTVAHELRNPLGAVAASISVIRARSAGAGIDLERSLARAERGIARCDRIITELLDFARAKGLQREPTFGGLWLSQVLDDYEIPDGIALSVDLPQEDVSVMLDREAGRRAVINLLDNACQAFAPDGDDAAPVRGTVEIRARFDRGRFVIEVQDYGPGIPPDLRSQVCDPLFTTKSFGTGLGLPTVRRIVEEHGGELTIESEEGQGTVARLTLPADESLPGDTEA